MDSDIIQVERDNRVAVITLNRPERLNAISRETRAKHNNNTHGAQGLEHSWIAESSLYCFAPMINVCRDPRWGRCQEGKPQNHPSSQPALGQP